MGLNPTEPELDFAGAIETLPLRDLAISLASRLLPEGEAYADFTLNGTIPQPKMTFKARVPDLQLANENLGSFSMVGEFEDNILNLPTITLSEPLSDGGEVLTASGHLDIADETFSLKADGRQLNISSLLLGQDWELAGLLDLSAKAKGSLHSPEFDLDLQIERPSLSGYELVSVAVKATLQNSQFVANALAADSGLSGLISGRVVHPFPVWISIRAEDTDLDSLPFLKQAAPELTGAVTGELPAQGDLSDWSGAQLSTTLTDLHFVWNSVEARNLEPLNVLYKNQSLLLENSVLTVGNGLLKMAGSLPLEKARSDSRLESDLRLDITDLLKLLPSDWQVEGTGELDLKIEVAGSLTSPEPSGQLRISKAALTGPRFQVPISDLEVAISLQENAIQLDQLSAIAGGDTFV